MNSNNMDNFILYDSMTRKHRIFVPYDSTNIKMYVCGPTVYDRAHLGNARSAVVFDQLFRILKHKYGVDSISYARNFTDIDDKIINRSNETGEAIDFITSKTIQWYYDDVGSLNVLKPTYEPRATEAIDDMIDLIVILLEKGFAYEKSKHILFDVKSYQDYGKLSGRTQLNLLIDHPELNAYKRTPGDFVLWKPSDHTQPGWSSPWGHGRPGWHIECSAMSHKTLGDRLDIHGGGIDLKFPHHENEIAQSTCSHGTSYGNYWVHNEMVTVNGSKMSKSLGNIVLVNDLIKTWTPLAIRYLLLGTHYRKPLDFTETRLKLAQIEYQKWIESTTDVESTVESDEFLQYLYNDMNIPGAIAVLRKLYKTKDFNTLKASMNLLGLI